MIRNLFLLIFFGFMLNTCAEKESRPVYTPVSSFDPTRDAEKDIQLALVEARRTHRNVLLDIGGEWCTWCHKLDTFFVQNKDVAEFMHQNYVVVKINYSPENKNEKVLAEYPEIRGYPHLFVLDEEGQLLHSQATGELEEGKCHDRGKVFHFLKLWSPGAVKAKKN